MNKVKESFAHIIFIISAATSILAVLAICIFVFTGAIPALKEIGLFNFLNGDIWRPARGEFGIYPMIIGSLYVTGGAIILGVPLGLLCAVFLSNYCPIWLYKIVKPLIELMAGIPSIIYGFFGIAVIVPRLRLYFGGSGKGILATSILLGIMILPTLVAVIESSLNAVPRTYYEGALALGATHERSIFCVVIPAAKSGIIAGIVLGIGRAIGETMAVVMVAGNSPIIPDSLVSNVRTLTTNIVLEIGYASDLHKDALIATGAVLFIFILIINTTFSIISRLKEN